MKSISDDLWHLAIAASPVYLLKIRFQVQMLASSVFAQGLSSTAVLLSVRCFLEQPE